MTLNATIASATSDTYATLAEYQAYAAAMGWMLPGTDAADEINLRRAAVVIDAKYSWHGQRQYSAQAREWPRVWLPLIRGFDTPGDFIPQAIKDGQCEMAYLIQGGADPFATVSGAIKRKREKADVLEEETEYAGGYTLPRYTAVDMVLGPYLRVRPGQSLMVRA
jgi:hypothetical protein